MPKLLLHFTFYSGVECFAAVWFMAVIYVVPVKLFLVKCQIRLSERQTAIDDNNNNKTLFCFATRRFQFRCAKNRWRHWQNRLPTSTDSDDVMRENSTDANASGYSPMRERRSFPLVSGGSGWRHRRRRRRLTSPDGVVFDVRIEV